MFFAETGLLVTGMQKDVLTMFRAACYSNLVPRVHPGLMCAATFGGVVCERSGRALEKRVSGQSEVRKHSSLKRSCGAFCPYAGGYAGQG